MCWNKMANWDPDIAAMNLSDWEKNGLQTFRNYTRQFSKHRFRSVEAEVQKLNFDMDAFTADIRFLEHADLKDSILAACSIADNLLLDMYKRDRRERLDMNSLVAPLGPLGDFSKRLRIAAFVQLIDTDTFTFFDLLRSLRNKIAHANQPAAPTDSQLSRPVDHCAEMFDVMATHPDGPTNWRNLPRSMLLKAACAIHLSKLAWQTLYMPLCRRFDVPVSHVWEEDGTRIFNEISAAGVTSGLRTLRLNPHPSSTPR
jgi:hypothetical protein